MSNSDSETSHAKTILLTAAEEDVAPVLEQISVRLPDAEPLHLPLERYEPLEDTGERSEILEAIDRFGQVAYGSLRNARFFLDAVRSKGRMEQLRKRVNLARDARTAEWLDEQGIPAIRPHAGESGDFNRHGADSDSPRAIDLMELMLRLRRTGPTLYPCGKETPEELPGLLRELDMEVEELVLFENRGPGRDRLETYRRRLENRPPGAVVFHSRRSVVRTLAAFPALDLERAAVVSADTAITGKLEEEGVTADLEGSGSWESVVKRLAEERS